MTPTTLRLLAKAYLAAAERATSDERAETLYTTADVLFVMFTRRDAVAREAFVEIAHASTALDPA